MSTFTRFLPKARDRVESRFTNRPIVCLQSFGNFKNVSRFGTPTQTLLGRHFNPLTITKLSATENCIQIWERICVNPFPPSFLFFDDLLSLNARWGPRLSLSFPQQGSESLLWRPCFRFSEGRGAVAEYGKPTGDRSVCSWPISREVDDFPTLLTVSRGLRSELESQPIFILTY